MTHMNWNDSNKEKNWWILLFYLVLLNCLDLMVKSCVSVIRWKKLNFVLLGEGMKKETKLTKTGIVYILTNKMKTESFEFDIPQKHGNWRYEDKNAFLYLNIILIYGPYGKELKKNYGTAWRNYKLEWKRTHCRAKWYQRAYTRNILHKNGHEISFLFLFFIKYIGNFCKRSRPPILLNLLEVLPKVILFVQG